MIISSLKQKMWTAWAWCLTIFFVGSTQLLAAEDGARQKASNLKNKTFQEFVTDVILLATKYILTLIVSLTVLVFLWGLAKYMFKGRSSDSARSEGRKLMFWGIIALFVMTSVWALVGIFSSFVGQINVVVPQFK